LWPAGSDGRGTAFAGVSCFPGIRIKTLFRGMKRLIETANQPDEG